MALDVFKRPEVPLLPMLAFLLQFTAPYNRHSVQQHPSTSSSCLSIHSSLHESSRKGIPSQSVNNPFLLFLSYSSHFRELPTSTVYSIKSPAYELDKPRECAILVTYSESHVFML